MREIVPQKSVEMFLLVWFKSVKIKNSQNIDNPLQQRKYKNYCPRITRVY